MVIGVLGVQGHTYRFVISINDDYKLIDSSCILSYTNNIKEMSKEPLECQQTDKGFTVDWICSADACKDGERNMMELMLPVDDYGNCRCSSLLVQVPAHDCMRVMLVKLRRRFLVAPVNAWLRTCVVGQLHQRHTPFTIYQYPVGCL